MKEDSFSEGDVMTAISSTFEPSSSASVLTGPVLAKNSSPSFRCRYKRQETGNLNGEQVWPSGKALGW